MIKAVIIHVSFGPYHLARAKALTRVNGINPMFIALTRGEQSHPWKVDGQSCSVPLITLSAELFERCRSARCVPSS